MAPLATAAAAATATPGAPSPPGRRVSWSVLGIGAALLLGWLVFGRGKEPAPATRKPPASEATLAPPPPFYPSPIRKKPEEPSGLYGGRTATWWKERLVALGSRADDEGRILYDATLRRARANGLTLEGEGPALRIVEPAMPTVAGGSRP